MDQKQTVIGIEFGSTNIKAVLLDKDHSIIASGSHSWENQLVDGVWTYSLQQIFDGLKDCYHNLKTDFQKKTGEILKTTGAIGVSAMMHGYVALDEDHQLLVPFRTWRNTMTAQAAEIVSDLFHFNIPQRWTIAHLLQAILNKEEHLPRLKYLTTLAGYVHYCLSGSYIVGTGEASGIMPLNYETLDYDEDRIERFEALIKEKGYPFKLRELFPKAVKAGEIGGHLTKEGALLLDEEGDLEAGIPLAPCEGDAGTGMVATNAVRVYTGNVSAGTSAFSMIVVDHELGVHKEVGMVTTPAGLPVAMVHCANCTSDINAWVNLFSEFSSLMGHDLNKGDIYTSLFNLALQGDKDGGGLMNYAYYSGEAILDVNEGRPLFMREPNARFDLKNFMRTQLMSSIATMKLGNDILAKEEKIRIDKLTGHGGFFRTPGVGQRLVSAALNAPVSVMETAAEGGPYGMALLCAYMLYRKENETLEDYLDNRVFRDVKISTVMADAEEVEGFNRFAQMYKNCLDVEVLSTERMK